MTADEYWNGDPWLAKSYRDAWEIRQDEQNYEAWLNGLYVYKAVAVVLGNAFRKKGAKTENYFEKPIDLKGEEKKTPKQIREEVFERLKAMEERWKNARHEHQDNN